MIKPLTKRFQTITALCSIVVILLLIVIFFQEHNPEWKSIQQAHQKIAFETAMDSRQREAIQSARPEIQQIILPELNRTDRCLTCHTGTTVSTFIDQPLPFKTHSGDYLLDHPTEQFGCTICHSGQGQAVDQRNAHARHPDVPWTQPLISMDHIQSSCGQCHLTIFSNSTTLNGTDIFQHGQKIFSAEGCLGCHKARGVGGSVGPDLTEQGEKTRHEYSFINISGEHSISNWLYEHFKDPETVSPGSDMLALELNDTDVAALVTFTMGMNKPDIPFDYFSIETLNEFKGQRGELGGEQLYPMICSACHGKNGEGKDYEKFDTGVASIGNQDFLSVASTDFLEFTIRNGRGLRQMAAWTPRFSGLKNGEIVSAVNFLKSQRIINSNLNDASTLKGNKNRGQQLYNENCLMCHGEDGRGAQVISISNPDFLAVADDEFLYQTIVNGRRNIAMPGWGQFSSQDASDIITHLRGWQTSPSRRGTFDASNGNAKNGEQLYHYRCSRCHGTYGQGDSGPALFTADLLDTASDYFLAEMITKGRHATAMFGWEKDVASKDRLSRVQVADIISFLRTSAKTPKDIIHPGGNLGHADTGKILFENNCAVCHGQHGEGVKAPALNNQELLNGATNGYLYATMSLGRQNTKMPSWGRGDENHKKLSIQERHDVVAFVRTWQNVVITNVK